MGHKIYIRLFYIGAFLAFFAFADMVKAKYFLNKGIEVEAKVVVVHKIATDDGYTYNPEFEYELSEKLTYRSPINSSPPSYKVGDKVELLINPKDESKIRIKSFWGLYRWCLILSLLAMPLLIFGGGYLLYQSPYNQYRVS